MSRGITTREKREIEFLMMANDALVRGGDTLKPRLKQVKGAWRDLCLVRRLTQKCLSAICATLDDGDITYLDRLTKNCQAEIRPKSVSGLPDIPKFIGRQDGIALVDAALERCAMCVKDDKQVERCKLRKALNHLCPPEEFPRFGCEYAHQTIMSTEAERYEQKDC